MKLVVNAPLAGNKLVSLLDGYNQNGITYELISKSGMRILFDVTGIEGQAAIDLTKRLIRDTDYGSVLHFQVMIPNS